MNHNILEKLSINSTELVEKHKLPYYWECDGFKFNNINLARWYEKYNKTWVKFKTTHISGIKKALEDKNLDENKNYNLDFLKNIRKKYDYIQFSASGGYDSTTIFLEAAENNIYLDELVSWIWLDIDNIANSEITENVLPLVQKYKDKIGKHSFLTTNYDHVKDYFSDPYAFFKKTNASPMPFTMGMLMRPSIDCPDNIKLSTTANSCYILCKDKPQVIYYNKKWYVVCIDTAFSNDFGFPNGLNFWLDPGNIKSLIVDARRYREYIKKQHTTLPNLKFFKFWDVKNSLNFVVNRTKLLNDNAQWPKQEKVLERFTQIAKNKQFNLMANYFKALEKFQEVFPETKINFGDYNAQSKFAWFIDIDTLELFTQEDFIPNGFKIV